MARTSRKQIHQQTDLAQAPKTYLGGAYRRLSVEDDRHRDRHSLENQENIILDFLKTHPDIRLVEVYTDNGETGTKFDRPGIKRVLELVRQRKVAAILVKDLSRFGRNYKEVGSYLEQVFPFLGVRFISVNDGYDSNEYIGSTGGLDIACKALVHDLYSRDISRKVKSSRYARLRRGDYFCSVAPYGYVKSSEDKHRLVIDPPAAKVVRRIFDMTLAGFCTTEIARTLNLEDVPSPLIYMRQKYPGKKIAALEDGFWNNLWCCPFSMRNDTPARPSAVCAPIFGSAASSAGKQKGRTGSSFPTVLRPLSPKTSFRRRGGVSTIWKREK